MSKEKLGRKALDFYKAIFEEMDLEKLQERFLQIFLDIQNVDRGSLWVERGAEYVCIDSAGSQSGEIKGLSISKDRPSLVGWVIKNGRMTISEPSKDERHCAEVEKDLDVKSRLILTFPLVLKDGSVYGALQIIDTSAEGNRLNLDQDYLNLLQELVDIGAIALGNTLAYSSQVDENKRLKRALREIRSGQAVIGQSPAFVRAIDAARDYAATDFPVLITGESGTGKEVAAREIHRLSRRADKPFLVQNCSAIPETLLESELFGYKKGAFTGANQDRRGLFEEADGGTVFLDEIGDMPISLQARILRFLQDGEIKPLGQSKGRKVNVRVLSATNKDLARAMSEKEFREDLFYRLNVLPLKLPPLRERIEDIPLLLDFFVNREARALGIARKRFSKRSQDIMIEYPWPGNIREMENFVKFILTTTEGDKIDVKDLPRHMTRAGLDAALSEPAAGPAARDEERISDRDLSDYSWDELERAYVLSLLERHKWNVTRAARSARVNRSTFDSRMKRLGVSKN